MPKTEKLYEFHVTGHWPFPVDMLRRDRARGATPNDQEKIEWLSKDEKPEGIVGQVTILIHSKDRPTNRRWQSFQWPIYGTVSDVEVTSPLSAEEQLATLELLRQARASIPEADAAVASAESRLKAVDQDIHTLEVKLKIKRQEREKTEVSLEVDREERQRIDKEIERLLSELD